MSFLEVFDRAAGATKSGGTTRRAAKMVCLDMDHPEIVDFINWKVREEKKAHALIAARLLVRLQRRGLPHDQRAELEQLACASPTTSCAPSTAGGKWQTRIAHHRRDLRDARRQGPLAPGRRGRVGLRRSRRAVRHDHQQAGTPARTRGASTRRTRARSTCSSTTRPATSSSVNLTKFLRDGRLVRRRRLPPRVPRLLRRAGDPRRSLELPDRSRSRRTATTTARSASATRTSARC